VTIQGIVKRYRHGGKMFWEYSINEFDKEIASGTDFESADEARQVALEKFKESVRGVLDDLNTDVSSWKF
jgi:hypothetical protein